MIKRNNKKGFTLAELLIVVAIIAVLTAIAVPLFVGSLNSAKDSTKNANMAAVREAAISKILLATDADKASGTGALAELYPSGTLTIPGDGVLVTATVSASGDIKSMTFKTASGSDKDDCVDDTSDGNKGGYIVTVIIKETQLTKASTGSSSSSGGGGGGTPSLEAPGI